MLQMSQPMMLSRRARPAGACLVRASAKGPLNGPGVVRLKGNTRVDHPIARPRTADAEIAIGQYMLGAASNFTHLALPLGGKLQRVDDTTLALTIPRFALFDVWLQPTALATIASDTKSIDIKSDQCTLDGSHHVKQFRLDEKFALDLNIKFTYSDSGNGQKATIHSEGSISVTVDLPPPFCYLPKPLIESTGDTALGASINLIMNTFVASLAEDYQRWSNDKALREQRMQEVVKREAVSATA